MTTKVAKVQFGQVVTYTNKRGQTALRVGNGKAGRILAIEARKERKSFNAIWDSFLVVINREIPTLEWKRPKDDLKGAVLAKMREVSQLKGKELTESEISKIIALIFETLLGVTVSTVKTVEIKQVNSGESNV
jgi:hypothetical protein